jgi:hypothetical protein
MMSLTYAERRLVGARIEQAVSQLRSMPEKSQEAQMVSYVVMRHTEPAIFVSASRRVSPELAHDNCLKVMGLADRYIAPTSHVLTVGIDLLEARIQYWFSLLPLSGTRDRPLDDPDAGSAPPGWIAFTPDAKF